MGCGCGTQYQAAAVGLSVAGPRQFLHGYTDGDFVRSLSADERKDKTRLLAYFNVLKRSSCEGQFEVTDEFRNLVRSRGVPPRFRWLAWRALSGWSVLYRPGLYERIRMLQRPADTKNVEAIEKDLDRTFPSIEEFGEQQKADLANVLRAYAKVFPQVGYCQGMNFVAGFLLLASGERQEDAFFMFMQMMLKYQANLLFCEGLPLLKLHTYQFRVLLERLFPDVHGHFAQHQITPELYATKWILTLFTQPLAFEDAARVWDLIVCDGLHCVVLAALASVKLLRARLLKLETEGIIELLALKKTSTPPSGGAIVEAAIALRLSKNRESVDAGLSKLRVSWEKENSAEADLLVRADSQLSAALAGVAATANDDGDGSLLCLAEGVTVPEEVVSTSIPNSSPRVAADEEAPAAPETPETFSHHVVDAAALVPRVSGSSVASCSSGSPVLESPSRAHLVGAEARVLVNTSMPSLAPSSLRQYDGPSSQVASPSMGIAALQRPCEEKGSSPVPVAPARDCTTLENAAVVEESGAAARIDAKVEVAAPKASGRHGPRSGGRSAAPRLKSAATASPQDSLSPTLVRTAEFGGGRPVPPLLQDHEDDSPPVPSFDGNVRKRPAEGRGDNMSIASSAVQSIAGNSLNEDPRATTTTTSPSRPPMLTLRGLGPVAATTATAAGWQMGQSASARGYIATLASEDGQASSPPETASGRRPSSARLPTRPFSASYAGSGDSSRAGEGLSTGHCSSSSSLSPTNTREQCTSLAQGHLAGCSPPTPWVAAASGGAVSATPLSGGAEAGPPAARQPQELPGAQAWGSPRPQTAPPAIPRASSAPTCGLGSQSPAKTKTAGVEPGAAGAAVPVPFWNGVGVKAR